jgi:arabinofuranosyltransferase
VFNAGERVEAYTGPLWLALLALAAWLLPFGLEQMAAVLSIALTAGGLLALAGGAVALWRAAGERRALVPLGAVVVAALPPFWDFATAGLEMGLALAWLGLAFLGLASCVEAPPSARRAAVVAVGIGLGPLARPDLGLFAAGFLAVLVALSGPWRWHRAAGLVACAAAAPLAYQVFRMGYFASLLPNTALAKEAGLPFWDRGLRYLGNAIWLYVLWLPLALLAAAAAPAIARWWGAGRRRAVLVAAAPVACGVVHAVYVVRLGGDYMHGRMLLPSLFGVLAPVAVVRLPGGWRGAVAAVAVVAWAVACAATLRAPSDAEEAPAAAEFLDQRRKQQTSPGHPHPLTLADHRPLRWSQPWVGDVLRRMAAERPGRVVIESQKITRLAEGRRVPARRPLPLPVTRTRPDLGGRLAVYTGSIGRVGYAAGPGVWVGDYFGLANPLAARLRLEGPRRRRAGHEKQLPVPWFLARVADPATLARDPAVSRETRLQVQAARRAMGCPPLRRLLTGVRAPLTPGRFLSNLGVAWELRSLRLAGDPRRAARELCG